MRDDRLNLPGRDALQIRFGDGVDQGSLDTGLLPEDLGFKGFLVKLRFAKGELPVPSDKRTIAGTIAMGSASRSPLMTIGASLLKGFQLHHEVQEPRDDTAHPFRLVGKIIFDTR